MSSGANFAAKAWHLALLASWSQRALQADSVEHPNWPAAFFNMLIYFCACPKLWASAYSIHSKWFAVCPQYAWQELKLAQFPNDAMGKCGAKVADGLAAADA